MVLDVSHDETIEKKPLDREAVILHVPEYEKDIYQYLREAEVSISIKVNFKLPCTKEQGAMLSLNASVNVTL